MRKQPGFTVAVLTLLALGTGANAAIFSVVDEMILHPLPFADGARMVELAATAGGGQFQITPPIKLIELWSSRARTVEEFTRYRFYAGMFGDTTNGGGREVQGNFIGPGMLGFTGLRPARGRDFLPADTMPGAPLVVMLGYGFWKRQFDGRDVIGSTVLLDGVSHTVIGIASPEFFVPYSSSRDLFVALRSDAKRGAAGVIAKLRRGSTIGDANRELASLGNIAPQGLDFVADPPKINDPSTLTRSGTRRMLYMLFGAVGLVLLISCANVANLLLARAWSRQREFAVRGAMGAGRGRIARQLFTESVVLAVGGGLLGFLVAIMLVKILVAIQPENIGIDGRINSTVFQWTLLISVLTGLLFGIAPALLIGDGRIGEVLKASARAVTGSRATRRLRNALVVAEVSLSVVLLVGAGLMVRTLTAMQRADLGMDPKGMSAMSVSLTGPIYKDSLARRDAWLALERRIGETPGIKAATITMTMPPDFAASLRPFEVEGRPLSAKDTVGAVAFNLGRPEFFKVIGIRFIAGRPYAADNRFSDQVGASEIVINERAAKRFWPSGAIGGRIKRYGAWATVVGVVTDVEVPGEKGLKSGIQIYQAISQAPTRASLVVRSDLPPTLVEPLLRRAIKESGIRVSVNGFSDVDTQLYSARAMHRFTLSLIGGFALLALVLAAVGLHAVIAYSVSQRLREIGIRIALGAQAGQVAGLVMRQGAVLAVIGIVVGAIGALAATRAMQSMLYGVEPGDPMTIAVVGALLVAVALMASAMPARRAVRVDPVEMVRAE